MIRKFFIATAATGLIINLGADLLIYEQQKVVLGTREWVQHSYQVGQAIEEAELSIRDYQMEVKDVDATRKSFRDLRALLRQPSLQELADRLVALPDEALSVVKDNEAHTILDKLEAAHLAFLSFRLNNDFEASRSAYFRTLISNAVDIILILLGVCFFFIYRRQTSRNQIKLTQSLLKVEETNLILMNSLSEKDQKLKVVVHDLKNPLGSIRGLAEIIRTSPRDENTSEHICNLIEKACSNSLELVSDLLSSEEMHIEKSVINIDSVINEICDMMLPLASDKGQILETKIPTNISPIWAPMAWTQDVLLNIVSNGIKFSPANSRIVISCEQKDAVCEIKVKDQGPGFSPEDLKRVFTYGGQLSAKPTAGEASSGIGLYSVNKLVQRMGGRIWVENNPDGGATVTVSLPIFSTGKVANQPELTL